METSTQPVNVQAWYTDQLSGDQETLDGNIYNIVSCFLTAARSRTAVLHVHMHVSNALAFVVVLATRGGYSNSRCVHSCDRGQDI